MIDKKVSRSVPPRQASSLPCIPCRNRNAARLARFVDISEVVITAKLSLVPDLRGAAFVSKRKQGYSNGRKFRPPAENSPARPQIPSSAMAAAATAATSRAGRCCAVPCRAESSGTIISRQSVPWDPVVPLHLVSKAPILPFAILRLGALASRPPRSLMPPCLPRFFFPLHFFISFFFFSRCLVHTRACT